MRYQSFITLQKMNISKDEIINSISDKTSTNKYIKVAYGLLYDQEMNLKYGIGLFLRF